MRDVTLFGGLSTEKERKIWKLEDEIRELYSMHYRLEAANGRLLKDKLREYKSLAGRAYE